MVGDPMTPNYGWRVTMAELGYAPKPLADAVYRIQVMGDTSDTAPLRLNDDSGVEPWYVTVDKLNEFFTNQS
jgi:hypothetical protein